MKLVMRLVMAVLIFVAAVTLLVFIALALVAAGFALCAVWGVKHHAKRSIHERA